MKALYRRGYLLTAAAAILLGGCATTQGERSSGDPDVLTRDQIMSVDGASSLYDVVKRLRPRWLQVRAADRSLAMTTIIAVYEDNTYVGDTQSLYQLQPGMAFEMRWMNGNRASDVLPGVPGGTHLAGAIIISTRPRKVGGE
jgi:hypothetical protein